MEENRKKKLGLKIQLLRKRKGFKQEEVAEKVGIDSKSLSRIEQGKHYPSMETLDSIADVLGVELKEVFEFSDDQESVKELRNRLKKCVDNFSDEEVRNLINVAKEIAKLKN